MMRPIKALRKWSDLFQTVKILKECTPKEAYYEDLKRSQISTIDKQFNLIKHLPLIKV